MALTTMMDGSGRIVIPKEIREEMEIDYGTLLTVEKENENTIRFRAARTGDIQSQKQDDNLPKERNNTKDSERHELRQFLES